MPRIGTFEDASNGRLRGSITSLGMSMSEIEMVPIAQRHPRGPQFMLFKDHCEIGRGWKAATLDGQEFLSVKLDSPVLPRPVLCKLFRIDDTKLHRLVWTERYVPDPEALRDTDEEAAAGEPEGD